MTIQSEINQHKVSYTKHNYSNNFVLIFEYVILHVHSPTCTLPALQPVSLHAKLENSGSLFKVWIKLSAICARVRGSVQSPM